MNAPSPYSEYKDSGVEWFRRVPENWSILPMKHALVGNDGGVWGDDAESDEGTIVLRSTEQSEDGKWKISDPAFRSLSAREAEIFRLRAGDLLVTKSSGSALHLGKTTIVDDQVEGLAACYSNFMQRLRVSRCNSAKYFWYVLRSREVREQINLLSTTSTGLANLTASVIGSFVIAVPSLQEQLDIAAYLDHETAEIDAFIGDQEELIGLLNERRAATITQAVTKGLDLTVPMKDSGFDWLGKVPEHWQISPLKRLGTIRYGLGEPPGYVSEGVPLIRATNVSEGRVTPEKMVFVNPTDIPAARILWLCEGDIIVVRSGAFTGDSAIIRSEYDGTIAGFDMVFRSKPSVNADFIQYGLLSSYVKSAQLDVARMRAAQPHLNAEELGNSYFAHPTTRAEYKQIVSYLDYETSEIDAAITDAKEAVELSKERRAALVSAAVTGKIDVRNRITAELGAA